MDTKKITITFEVDDNITPEMLHEALCRLIHESTIDHPEAEVLEAIGVVVNGINDIQ